MPSFFTVPQVSVLTPSSPSTRASKSQLKRDAQALRAFGVQLVALKASMLAKMPLDDALRSAIILAQSLKRSAQRRQLNYIGKRLRAMPAMEMQPLQHALNCLTDQRHR